jgi:hypothetical protein
MTTSKLQPQERILFLLCRPRYVQVIMQEIKDWTDAQGGSILAYGKSDKAGDGFVLSLWPGPIPAIVWNKLLRDSDIFDFVLCQSTQDEPENEPAAPQE